VHLTLKILSSAPYFFTNAERFAEESFRPTDQDVTMAKLRTTGIVETTFTMSSVNFTLVDVGGQVCTAVRKTWLMLISVASGVSGFTVLIP
jgi:guanine nucleotide-binding protein subunit alpha